MLALTRRIGDKIMIGENIVITVAEIKGDSVRLGIQAPKEIKIYRGELYEAIEAANKQAAAPSQQSLEVLKTLNSLKQG